MSKEYWEMSFDLNTLEHLGVKLYTQYPPMIAELVSNSWDAYADNVKIKLYDHGKKKIIVEDDGESMNAEELNTCFLAIGRNRRTHVKDTRTKKRQVMGKKGIGKLSMFGIAEKITVKTVKDGLKNSFLMDYPKMKKSGNSYKPEPLEYSAATGSSNGTVIILEEIKRRTNFSPKDLATSLSKRFSIFDKINVEIYHNDNFVIKVENEDLYKGVTSQFKWSFPDDFIGLLDNIGYYKERDITGVILTSNTPLNKNLQGVTLLARGKLVQENAYFDDRSNDYFHSYLYGTLNVDFVDADDEIDNVSTDRKSLVWEGSELEELKSKLNDILKAVSNDWRKKRQAAKKDTFKKIHDVDVDKWLDGLNAAERPLAIKISDAVISNTSLDDVAAAKLFTFIQDAYSLQGFKDFAATLDSMDSLNEDVALKLINDWQFIEAKELAKIADGRISTINQFEKYIKNNVSETKVMQKFLEMFPWILDPRMTNFEREVTYSKWLKEKFPDDVLEGSNRRIDFICTNNNGIVHIIELKRPNIKIGMKEIEQISQYIEFITNKCPETVKEVKAILISENHNYGLGVKKLVESLRASGDFEIKSYSDLLDQARRYHSDFIDTYDELSELKI